MKKESVNKFDLEAAFKALEEIEIPVVKGIKPNRLNLQEHFTKKLTSEVLVEDYYDVNDQGDLEAAQEEREAEVAKAKLARIEKIVDLDAESEEDLLPSYVGKVIIQCPQCMTLFYKNQEDIAASEENPDVVNVNEVCQHCGNSSGYTLIGKVDKVGEEEAKNYNVEDFDENELNLDFEDAEESSEESEEKSVEDNVEDATAEEGNEEELELEPVKEVEEASEDEEVKESLTLNEKVEDESEEVEETPNEEILTSVDEVKDVAEEAAEAVLKASEEEALEDVKEVTDEVVENHFEVSEEEPEKDDSEEKADVEESLNESIDKDLDAKLKAHNEYIEYLKKMLKQEEEALSRADNEYVKKAIQRRIDAFKADLEDALPEDLKNEVETDLPTAEEIDLEATENVEEPKEETKESLTEATEFEKIINDLLNSPELTADSLHEGVVTDYIKKIWTGIEICDPLNTPLPELLKAMGRANKELDNNPKYLKNGKFRYFFLKNMPVELQAEFIRELLDKVIAEGFNSEATEKIFELWFKSKCSPEAWKLVKFNHLTKDVESAADENKTEEKSERSALKESVESEIDSIIASWDVNENLIKEDKSMPLRSIEVKDKENSKKGIGWLVVYGGKENLHKEFKNEEEAKKFAKENNGKLMPIRTTEVESLKEEKINIDYVVSLFGDDSHYYKEDDVKLSPDISGATKFNKKKDISILDIVKDICEYESKHMPENEVASLFDLDTLEEVYEKDEDYFINSGLVKIITVYKNKKIKLPESLEEAIQKNPNISAEEINKIIKDKKLSQKEKAKKIYEDVKIISDLSDYKPWSGAVDTWNKIQEANKIDELDAMLEEVYPDGLTMTELNDILWFDSEWVLSGLGITEEVEESLTEATPNSPRVRHQSRREIFAKELVLHPAFEGLSIRDLERYIIDLYLEDDPNAELNVDQVVEYVEDLGWGKIILDNIDNLSEGQIRHFAQKDPVFVSVVKEFLGDWLTPNKNYSVGALVSELLAFLGKKPADKEEAKDFKFDPNDKSYKEFKDELVDMYYKAKNSAPVKEAVNSSADSLQESGDLDTLLDSEEFKKPISDAEVENIIAKYESLEEDVAPGIESELAIQDIVDTWESIEEIDEESLDKLTENYLTEVYSNVKSFKTTNCTLEKNKLVVEGKITFNSGKEKNTKFVFEAKKENNKIILEGLNADFATEKAFVLNCNLDTANRLVVESLSYKYTINNTLVEGLAK